MRKANALKCWLVGTGALATVGHVGSALAGVIFNSGGFEPSAGYTPSSNSSPQAYLYGQPYYTGTAGLGQWTAPYTNPFAGVYTYSSLGFTPTAGNQNAVVLESTFTSTPGEAYPLLNSFTPSAANGTNQVAIAFQEAIGSGASGNPFLGVVAYDGNMSDVGQVGINAATGALVGVSDPSFTATAGTFYNFELLLNYTTKTYSVYESPIGSSFSLVGTNPFLNLTSTTFLTAALTSYSLDGNTESSVGYFDNFSITAVPEPAVATLVLGGLSLFAAGRRRRRLQNLVEE